MMGEFLLWARHYAIALAEFQYLTGLSVPDLLLVAAVVPIAPIFGRSHRLAMIVSGSPIMTVGYIN